MRTDGAYKIISDVCAYTGRFLSDEQRDVAANFNQSLDVDANPGTGKTTTAVVGLIAAETYHKIPGNKINAMSFTIEASAELTNRYVEVCKQCYIRPTVKFNTFHNICRDIIREKFSSVNFILRPDAVKEMEALRNYLPQFGIPDDDMYLVRKLYYAMNSLNSAMVFSDATVAESLKYKELNRGASSEYYVSVEAFQGLRRAWIFRMIQKQSIPRGQEPLVALSILNMFPNIQDIFKEQYELMVVDEFQDMSVMYLEILRLISKRLVVIGDIKQQIYAFNGACSTIKEIFKEMYPNSLSLQLTQSFRCKDEIADAATRVIAPNKIPGSEDFKGCGDGGHVRYMQYSPELLEDMIDKLNAKDSRQLSETMILARNNESVIPITEMLFQKGIPFRTGRFKMVKDIPIFKEMDELAQIALNPTSMYHITKLHYIMPEFRFMDIDDNYLLQVMKSSKNPEDKNIFTIRMNFREESSYKIINGLKRFVELNNAGRPYLESLKPLYNIYTKYILEDKWWKLDQKPEYYTNLVKAMLHKTYDELCMDENSKSSKNEYYMKMREGIRCYTCHTSKGLEAENIYIIDADDDILFAEDKLQKYIDNDCLYEASRELRNERNLIYVAMTRAKTNLNILFKHTLSCLISDPDDNKYTYFDKIYEENKIIVNESEAFKRLLKVEW